MPAPEHEATRPRHPATAARADALDATDPLAHCRGRFLLPSEVIYLDGNSLGALSAGVPGRIDDVVRRQWGRDLIRSWNDNGWWEAPLRVGDRIARLLGAAPGQVVVGDSTSVQLFNVLVAATRLRPDRTVLLTDPAHFPSDQYIVDSVARLLGLRVERVPVPELAAAFGSIGAEVAAVCYGAVDYRTGERWPMGELTAAAHEVGALTVWDLCHAVGALPLRLDADEVDFAVGCTYKYLSGGPGSPAFSYVPRRHSDCVDLPLAGWTGHRRPFDMVGGYEPADGVARGRIGTPPMLSLLALDAALDAFDGLGLELVRAKSLSLSGFFLDCVDALLVDEGAQGSGVEVVTPRDPDRRGSQVSLRHPEAGALVLALIERHVIGDMRAPDLLRFGLNALYVTHRDVFEAVRRLREVLDTGAHRAPRFRARGHVT